MRRKPPGRLAEIAEAAILVFTRQGYRRCQVADIAAELGVSVGSLYSYASGKEALAQLALLHLLEQPLQDLALPFAGGVVQEKRLARLVGARGQWPLLAQALADMPGDARQDTMAELAAIIGELFDMTLRERRLIRFLDACALHMPALARQFITRIKQGYIEDLQRYLVLRQQQGRLALPGPSAAGSTRAMLEMVAWLSLHRQADAVPPPLDDAQARATAIAFAQAAFRA